MKLNFDINALFEQIAKAFGTTVENAKPYLEKYLELVTREVVAKGIINIVLSLISMVLIILLIIAIVKVVKLDDYDYDDEFKIFSIGFISFGLIVCILVFCINLDIGVRRLINPEYHAIQQIAEDIGLKEEND